MRPPIRSCIEPGCLEYTTQSRCRRHAEAFAISRLEAGATGHRPNTPEWRRLRRRVRKRDRVCRWCGSSHRLEVHHANHDATDNRMANLILLCKRCHDEHHRTQDRPR